MTAARSAATVEHEVGALRRSNHDPAILQALRFDRLAIESDERGLVTLELEPVDARIRRVDQPQADPLAGAHVEGLANRAVDRDCVADAPGVTRIHEAAEIAG